MKTLIALMALGGWIAPACAAVITQGSITVNAAYDGASYDMGEGTWHVGATSQEFGGSPPDQILVMSGGRIDFGVTSAEAAIDFVEFSPGNGAPVISWCVGGSSTHCGGFFEAYVNASVTIDHGAGTYTVPFTASFSISCGGGYPVGTGCGPDAVNFSASGSGFVTVTVIADVPLPNGTQVYQLSGDQTFTFMATPEELLAILADDVAGLNHAHELVTLVTTAQADIAAGDFLAGCAQLAAFGDELKERGHEGDAPVIAKLTADLVAAEQLIGCPVEHHRRHGYEHGHRDSDDRERGER